jgi:hypothetical protein
MEAGTWKQSSFDFKLYFRVKNLPLIQILVPLNFNERWAFKKRALRLLGINN